MNGSHRFLIPTWDRIRKLFPETMIDHGLWKEERPSSDCYRAFLLAQRVFRAEYRKVVATITKLSDERSTLSIL